MCVCQETTGKPVVFSRGHDTCIGAWMRVCMVARMRRSGYARKALENQWFLNDVMKHVGMKTCMNVCWHDCAHVGMFAKNHVCAIGNTGKPVVLSKHTQNFYKNAYMH